MLKNENICVDIETLSTYSNAVIVTIAAIRFDLKSDSTETFSVNVNPRESKSLGLHISHDTLDWWKTQPKEAMHSWMHSQVGIKEALTQFTEWCGDSKHTNFWANGVSFDFPILKSSYDIVGLQEPWKYYNLMDMRTIYKIAKLNFNSYPRVGLYHNALDDCMTQIKALKECMG